MADDDGSPPMSKEDQAAAMVMDMGYAETDVRAAIQAVGLDISRIISYLSSPPGSPVFSRQDSTGSNVTQPMDLGDNDDPTATLPDLETAGQELKPMGPANRQGAVPADGNNDTSDTSGQSYGPELPSVHESTDSVDRVESPEPAFTSSEETTAEPDADTEHNDLHEKFLERQRDLEEALADHADGSLYSFPELHLVRLENTIFKDRWVVPLEANEPLGICMQCILKRVQHPGFLDDTLAQRFLSTAMSTAFEKLLDSNEVSNWPPHIQSKIRAMSLLLAQLTVAVIPFDNIPTMEALGKAINSTSNWVIKNRLEPMARSSQPDWVAYAEKPVGSYKFERGWMLDVVNEFGNAGGFVAIRERIQEGIRHEEAQQHNSKPVPLPTPAAPAPAAPTTTDDDAATVDEAPEPEEATAAATAAAPDTETPEVPPTTMEVAGPGTPASPAPATAITGPAARKLSGDTLAAFLKPFGHSCDDYFTAAALAIFDPLVRDSMELIAKFPLNDLPSKEYEAISEVMEVLKKICSHELEEAIDQFRLDVAAKLMQSTTYNGKMNALKEVNRLCGECRPSSSYNKSWLTVENMSEWLRENKVIEVALKANLHHLQYVKKIEEIVQFVVRHDNLSLDALTQIWDSQVGKHDAVVTNIQDLLARLAWYFQPEQLAHLLLCFKHSWDDAAGDNKVMEALLQFVMRLAKDDRDGKMASDVLTLLWDLAHGSKVPTGIVEQALKSQIKILSSHYITDTDKKSWMDMWAEDLAKSVMVVPALQQLQEIAKLFPMYSTLYARYTAADRSTALKDFGKKHAIEATIAQSLLTLCEAAKKGGVTKQGGANPAAAPAAVEDDQESSDAAEDPCAGRYSHDETVRAHLEFLRFFVSDSNSFVGQEQVLQIWECLIEDPVEVSDVAAAFEWFSFLLCGDSDLDTACQEELYTSKVLHLDPCLLTEPGFECVQQLFVLVNSSQKKLITYNNQYRFIVNQMDLFGLDYIWKVALQAPCENIANAAIDLLRTVFGNLSQRLQQDVPETAFLDECMNRLLAKPPAETTTETSAAEETAAPEAQPQDEGGAAVAESVNEGGAAAAAAPVAPPVAATPTEGPAPAVTATTLVRCLMLLSSYVDGADDVFTQVRMLPPHKVAFRGQEIDLRIDATQPKAEFIVKAHTSEPLSFVRQQIANHLGWVEYRLKVTYDAATLKQEYKRLSEAGITCTSVLSARQAVTATTSYSSTAEVGALWRPREPLSVELRLPSVLVSTNPDWMAVMLDLADHDNREVRTAARQLLNALPTSPLLLDQIRDTCMAKDEAELLRVIGALTNSPFRLRYTLEALYQLLFPSTFPNEMRVRELRQSFLGAGGIQALLAILDPSNLQPNADVETRKHCFSIALDLCRFLVRRPAASEAAEPSPSEDPGEGAAAGVGAGASEGSVEPLVTQVDGMTVVLETKASRVEVKHGDYHEPSLGAAELQEATTSLLQLFWASATGRLQSQDFSQASLEERSLAPAVGLDATIAKQVLGLLTELFKETPALSLTLTEFPALSVFLVDCLVGSSHREIRDAVESFLAFVVDLDVAANPVSACHERILELLITARLPFWVSGGPGRHRGQLSKYPSQALQYFQSLSGLLKKLQVRPAPVTLPSWLNLKDMLDTECLWLSDLEPDTQREDEVQVLLTGHLRLCATLLSFDDMDKLEIGQQGGLMKLLITRFLFSASEALALQLQGQASADTPFVEPLCSSSTACRRAAFECLVELCRGCNANLAFLVEYLTSRQNRPEETLGQWDFLPVISPRPRHGHVGLKNAGATCYMNSVLQQLYMNPFIRANVLRADDDVEEKWQQKQSAEDAEEHSVFYQLQSMFGHLQESRMEHFVPKGFWETYKLWGMPVNLREHQDAVEFFTNLVDQLDEHLKAVGFPKIFQDTFGGVFVDQKVCKPCPHRYEREEPFMSMSVNVRGNKNLTEALQQYVKGDLLTDDNKYYCEKCDKKVDAVKRTCIKKLPKTLVVHLKRFDYDWDNARPIKFNDHFEFPSSIDMGPFTAEGLTDERPAKSAERQNPVSEYNLVGVVVHSGVANAGHYYSFVRAQRSTKDKWYKFNDTQVTEVTLGDEAWQSEFFGGKYSSEMTYHSEYDRSWSAYLLVYERADVSSRSKRPQLLVHRSSSMELEAVQEEADPQASASGEQSPTPSSDSDSSAGSMANLVDKMNSLVVSAGSAQAFECVMPATISRSVHDSNLEFLHQRDVYDVDYFQFVFDVVGLVPDTASDEQAVMAVKAGLTFLMNTALHTKKYLREMSEGLQKRLHELLRVNRAACDWAMQQFASSSIWLSEFFLGCGIKDVRAVVHQLLETAIISGLRHGIPVETFRKLMAELLGLIAKISGDQSKNTDSLFGLLSLFTTLDENLRKEALELDFFPTLIRYFLGVVPSEAGQEESFGRRWQKTAGLAGLHGCIGSLVCGCNVSHLTSAPEQLSPYCLPHTVELLPLAPQLEFVVFKDPRYLSDAMPMAFEEPEFVRCLLHGCWLNAGFSVAVTEALKRQLSTATDVRPSLAAAGEVLRIEDSLQMSRIAAVVGCKSNDGLITMIQKLKTSNAKRAYHFFKFIVELLNESAVMEQYMRKNRSLWATVVNWLEDQLRTSGYSTSWNDSSTSNESSSGREFVRTISAKSTLASARRFLDDQASGPPGATV